MDGNGRSLWRGGRLAVVAVAAVLVVAGPGRLAASPVAAAGVTGRQFTGVACTSAANCWAVGVSTSSAGVTSPLIEHWNGAAWSVVSSPNLPGSTDTFLNGPSCTVPANCWAVGGAVTSSNQKPIAEHWNGTKWSLIVLPAPSGLPNNGLASVSCTSTGTCMATGSSAKAGLSSGPTLAERWNGTSWSVVPTPNLNGGLNHVSCTSASNCWAVGISSGALAEHWNGTAWSVAATPSGGDDLFGVSCLSSTCLAAGLATSGFGLAERWNGSTWAVTAAPDPPGTAFSEFTSVSCTAATACTMAGFYFTTADKTLIETWNGSSWKVVASPNPTGSTLTSLHGVWCTSTTDCWAVGLHQQKAGQNSTLAEHWNGTQWSIVATP